MNCGPTPDEKDIDLESGTVRVLHGKGDRFRTVGIDAGATDLIREWLACRAEASSRHCRSARLRLLPRLWRGASPMVGFTA
jgi:site-specific recombinase XerC